MFNAEVLFREDCTQDEFIDVIMDNRIYLPCLYVSICIIIITVRVFGTLLHLSLWELKSVLSGYAYCMIQEEKLILTTE